ncbi:MAG: helix-hairpin-helix domain-containing protein [Akkermansiaceae bacterium]|nr:helix-hairpin-helix domain-containing protein [Akkermansiaceae bacterium]
MKRACWVDCVSGARVFAVVAWVLLSGVAHTAGLKKIENCTLVPAPWADGDSFQIQIPAKAGDGKNPGHKAREINVRLYGADCIESKIHDATDGRRVRAQRRYFGITEVGGSPQASIALALKYGNIAAKEIPDLLAQPFTVQTAFADGRGDPNFKRYYAFVVTADGKDLASLLVSKGLARAFGVYRETFDGRTAKEYKAQLADLELQAAKKGAGVWEHTDWENLPGQRQAQRDDDRENEIGIDKKQKVPANKIHINKASRDELMSLPGIGEAMANRIIEKRPYRKAEDLLKVTGIGKKTLEKLRPFLVFPAG